MTKERPAVTRALAEFVAARRTDLVTDAATDQVRRAVIDLCGVVVAGAATDAGALALRHAQSQSAPGPAAVLGSAGARLAPTAAAFVNGTAGHALDLDDIGLGAGHVSVAMVPAALAVAELVDASGRDLVDALAIGYEVAGRLTRVAQTDLDGPYEKGFHKPSVYAAFGGAAATAHLLRLDADATATAFGIVATEAGGLRINFGTMTKPMHAGLANRTAVEAALLAAEGFTAAQDAIEGRFGWFDGFFDAIGDLDRVLDGLGTTPLAIEEGMRFKPYPSCGANHVAIEGVLTLLKEHGLQPHDITTVDVAINQRYLDEVLVYPWPRSPLEGKFSLAYNVAAAVADGAVTVATFEDDALARLAPMQAKVRTTGRADLGTKEAVVSVTTSDGEVRERTQTSVRGDVDTPFTDGDLGEKFLGASTPAALELLRALDTLPTLRHLTDELCQHTR